MQVLSLIDPETGVPPPFSVLRGYPLNESNPDGWSTCWNTGRSSRWEGPVFQLDHRFEPDADYRLGHHAGWTSRWKIENETFNTLKNQGYRLEHNFGHGNQNLSVVLALVMFLAFLVDQVQQLCCPLFQAAWHKMKTKSHLWEEIRSHFRILIFGSMEKMLITLIRGITPQTPVFENSS